MNRYHVVIHFDTLANPRAEMFLQATDTASAINAALYMLHSDWSGIVKAVEVAEVPE